MRIIQGIEYIISCKFCGSTISIDKKEKELLENNVSFRCPKCRGFLKLNKGK